MTLDQIVERIGLRRLGNLVKPFERVDTPPPQTLVPFLLWCLRGAYPALFLACLASIIVGTFDVISAMLLGSVIDTALNTGPDSVFSDNVVYFLLVGAFLLFARPIGFGVTAAFQSIVVAPNVSTMALTRLHRWTMGQAVTFFDNDFAGRIAQKQMQTSRAVADVAMETINSVVFATASFIAATLLLVSIDWRLSLVTFVWLIAYVVFLRYFMPKIRVKSAARAAARAGVTGQVVDTITNMRTVKLFANRHHEDDAALQSFDGYLGRSLDFGVVSTTFRFLLILLAGVLPLVLIGCVLILWSNGTASAGAIAATGTVSLRLSQMTGWVSFTLLGIYANIGEIEDGIRTLSPRHELTDRPNAVDADPTANEVRFENVTFAYGRKNGGVDAINLHIKSGEKVGIVGASGAGKSTLVSLLLRLYDTEQGAVKLGETDVRDLTQESLRRQIGMVTQETAMFNRTARANIKYGRPNTTDDQMIDAARRAEAHDFILDLEDHKKNAGYDAFLGERGVKLSGGQRQRIALARAILKDAPILILDEATSALDSEVEAQIQSALERVMEGKTVLAIAHRLSTIARMDRILVMEIGRIVEQGTHTDLLASGGVYARFWQRQSGGFLGVLDAAE
jgi:ATP-binding cassette subfamily B protein